LDKTKIFISWSGDRGHEVARALHWWLPHVISNIDPIISEHNIEKGTLWRSKLADQLKDTKFGLICLTPENQNTPWILFESGALSKDKNPLWTFLLGFEDPSEVESPPLADINHTMGSSKDDVKKLIININKEFNEELLSEKIVIDQFDMWWPKLNETLISIKIPTVKQEKRSSDSMIEEILSIVRSISRNSEKYSTEVTRLELSELILIRELLKAKNIKEAIYYLDNYIYKGEFDEYWVKKTLENVRSRYKKTEVDTENEI
jgi:hypothetical protein